MTLPIRYGEIVQSSNVNRIRLAQRTHLIDASRLKAVQHSTNSE